MGHAMFKLGLLHGLAIFILEIVTAFALTKIGVREIYFEIASIFIIIIPMMVVGYIYKARANISLIAVYTQTKGRVMLYPLGVALFTTALSTYGAFTGDDDILSITWLIPVYFIGVVGQTLKLATAIWVGSWFKKVNP